MYSVWAKRLLPAPVATGTVCLTMHLTNQHKTVLDSMNLLDLADKPDINEQEIVPKVMVPPKTSTSTGGNDGSGEPSTEDAKDDQTGQDDSKPDSQPDSPSVTQSSPDQTPAPSSPAVDPSSTSQQPVDVDVRELIRAGIKEIYEKSPTWTSGSTTLVTSYELSTRLKTLLGNLEALKQQGATPPQS